MRKYIQLTCLGLISFAACSKKGTESKPVPVASVSFMANGNSYNWKENGGDDRDPNYLLIYIYTSAPGMYHLTASNTFSTHLHPAREVSLTFEAPTLTTGTPYTFTNTTASNYYAPHAVVVATTTTVDPEHIYTAFDVGDLATVTITSLHEGLADGTFTAALTRMSDKAKVTVTGGTFKNVAIN